MAKVKITFEDRGDEVFVKLSSKPSIPYAEDKPDFNLCTAAQTQAMLALVMSTQQAKEAGAEVVMQRITERGEQHEDF